MRVCSNRRVLISAVAGISVLGFAGATRANLTIIPTFDSSITPDMMTAINLADAQFESKLLNNVTVRITFVADQSVGLGQSSTSVGGLSYQTYYTDLHTKQALSANDNTALATLPTGPNNPVNGSTGMSLSVPLLRVLGESGPSAGPDSTISLKTSAMNILRTGSQDPNKYDMQQVVMHEVTEVLGAGGGGSSLGDSGTDVGSLDLYRYSAPGVRSYSTAASTAYFSIDGGTTNLSFFNQQSGADYADWATVPPNAAPQVQDAFGTSGIQLNLDSNELTSLDVVGWDIAVPEPASIALLGLGSVGLLARRRRA